MREDREKQERILTSARRLFMERGFSKVTMDELAFELGISKKTLYEFYPSKKELLRQAMRSQIQIIENGLKEAIASSQENFIDRLGAVSAFLGKHLPRPSRAFLEDMRRQAPDIWEEIDRSRARVVRRYFRMLFEEAKREGLLRDDVEVDFLLLAMVTLLQGMANPRKLSELPLSAAQVYRRIIRLVTLGVLSEKGRRAYDRLLMSEEE